jgi:hypothetical protein
VKGALAQLNDTMNTNHLEDPRFSQLTNLKQSESVVCKSLVPRNKEGLPQEALLQQINLRT